MRDGSRGRELLPSILLTLLSVVQALALEALWSGVRESPWLWDGGIDAWIGWLQVIGTFQGIVVIWLFYIGIVMRFSWVPTTRDSIAPFVLGAGELSMISCLGPQWLHYWFFILAAVFVFSTRTSNAMFRAGIADPTNRGLADYAVDERPLARLAPYIAAGLIALAGALVAWRGPQAGLAIGGLLLSNVLLTSQGMLIQHYWRQWVGGESESP